MERNVAVWGGGGRSLVRIGGLEVRRSRIEEICTSDRHASEKIFSCACLHMKMGFLYRPPSETLAISQLAFSRPICPLKENFELRGFFWDIAM